MSSMTPNQQAVYLAKYFFMKTERRCTKATMAQSIGQAHSLLEAGFSPKEIEEGVDWCVANPPPKGFNSLGWLSYDLENILRKIKAKAIKEELNNRGIDESVNNLNCKSVVKRLDHQLTKKEDRVSKDFDFKMFE